MFNKFSRIIICIFLLFSMLPVQTVAATTIGEDVSRMLPILTEMETTSEATAIGEQLTSVGGTTKLTQDRVAGSYSVVVEVGDIVDETHVNYMIIDSTSFNIDDYSQVKLWVKPGEGGQWAEFFIRDTNEPTPNEIAIKSDQDQDGKYAVGVDLVSGQWNEVTLDLTKTATSLTQGQDLVVKTNDDSTWYYDSIKSVHASVTSLDLSHMVNTSTEIINGALQFKTNGADTFDITPTVVVLNRYPSFSRTDTTQADFNAGTLDKVQATTQGSIKFVLEDQCSGGNPISSLSYDSYTYPNSYAFDNNHSTYWRSEHSGTNVSGNAYIGYYFGGSAVTVRGVRLKQGAYSTNGVTSVKLQYYNSGWYDLQTFSVSNSTSAAQDLIVDNPLAATNWRLMANSNPTNNWYVFEVEMWKDGSYTSPIIDISSLVNTSNSKINWITSESDKVKVETRISDDGGTSWQPGWTTATDGGEIPGIVDMTDFTNGRLQYRLSLNQVQDWLAPTLPELDQISIKISGKEYQGTPILSKGRIQRASIGSGYSTVNTSTDLQETSDFLTDVKPTLFDLSDDGRKLFYLNPVDSNKLYILNFNTGVTAKISDVTGIISIKSNYDGTKVAYQNNTTLYNYNSDLAINPVSNGSSVQQYVLRDDGTLVYNETNGIAEIHLYTPSRNDTVIRAVSASYLDVAKKDEVIYYSNGSRLYQIKPIAGVWQTIELLDNSSTIQGIWTNNTGSIVYLKYNNYLYSYDVQTKALRKLDLPANNFPLRVTKDDKLIFQDSYYDYLVYDPNTDKSVSIRPIDSKSPGATSTFYFDVNSDGNNIAYVSQDSSGNINGIKTYYFNGVERPERYLMSFNGKKSWYTFQGGNWILVSTELTPSTADFATYGLTVDEVNALNEADFASLYDGNREIYSFDVAVYFASVDPYTTPSLKSIKVTVNQDSTPAQYLDKSLYAAKEKTFDATNWRKINKLYPVQIAPKEAPFYYFIQKNGLYQVYKDGAWTQEDPVNQEFANLLTDVEANWIEITQQGMTAEELRGIPQGDLTSELSGQSFSVVYAIKVEDLDTKEYSSLISADYVEDLFSGVSFTLNVTLNDGTVKQYTGVAEADVENFMEWISRRQYDIGQLFYHIATATGDDFINFYKIQAVSVE